MTHKDIHIQLNKIEEYKQIIKNTGSNHIKKIYKQKIIIAKAEIKMLKLCNRDK